MRASALIVLAALGAACALPVNAADELGTLFFTPQERAALDRLRRGEPETLAPRLARHSVTGFVRRSDGRNTVWIDGAPIPINGAAPEALLRPQPKRDTPPATGEPKVERKDPR